MQERKELRTTKIVHIVSDLEGYNGAANQARLVAEASSNPSLIVNLAPYRIRVWRLSSGIPVLNISRNFVLQFAILFFVCLRNFNSVFHLHGIKHVPLLVLVLLRRRFVLKTAMDGVDDLQAVSQRRFGNIKVSLLRKCRANVVLSDYALSANSHFLELERIYKVPNGVVVAPDVPVSKEGNYFCFAGVICERKAPLESISYFAEHYMELPQSHLFLAGPNSESYGVKEFSEQYYQECLEYISENGMESKVTFLGKVGHQETIDLFARCKALLFFSKAEGMPNVVLEAMSQNCCPILGEMQGVSKEIVGVSSGFVLGSEKEGVEIEDVEQLIASCAPYLRVRNDFSIQSTSQKLDKLYEFVSRT